MIWVTKAKYEDGCRLREEFNDGRRCIIDLADTVLNDTDALQRDYGIILP